MVKDAALRSGVPKKQADLAIRAAFELIVRSVYDQKIVTIPNFGYYFTSITESKIKVLPNGHKYWAPRRLSAKFKWHKQIREILKSIPIEQGYDNENTKLDITGDTENRRRYI